MQVSSKVCKNKKKIVLGACVALLGLGLLSGCTSTQNNATSPKASQSEEVQEKIETKVAKQYHNALTDCSGYFSEVDVLNPENLKKQENFEFALVNLNTAPVPYLLVRYTEENTSYCKVLAYNNDAQTPDVFEGVLIAGEELGGGFSGSITLSNIGNGLITRVKNSRKNTATISRVIPESKMLNSHVISLDQFAEDSTLANVAKDESEQIDWKPVIDQNTINAYEQGNLTSTITQSEEAFKEALSKKGMFIFTGTFRIINSEDLAQIQGVADPNANSPYAKDRLYTVVVLDKEQSITARNGDGRGYRDGACKIVGVQQPSNNFPGDLDEGYFEAIDGKTVTIVSTKERIAWPSDTSLPLGEPRMYGFYILS